MKEYPRVHEGFIQKMQYLSQDSDDMILSSSHDGHLTVWTTQSAEEAQTNGISISGGSLSKGIVC
jgi:hypothetical protein